MSDDPYIKLRDFLHALPAGFPTTESGVELKILKKLYTPEEAEMAVKLTQVPETAAAIAGRTGIDTEEVSSRLESMAKKGLVFRVAVGEETYYEANMFAIGVYEFNINRVDREFAEMMEEYLEPFGEFMRSVPTKQLRVVPVAEAIDAVPGVASYDQVRELVRAKDAAAVAPCICRKEKGLLGYDCPKPHETCLTFGAAAHYYVDNGIGREISIDEALKILDRAEEAGLVLMPTNAENIMNICCCCECCCGVLRMLTADPRPADMVQTSFQARIDPDACMQCETCVDRCQVAAIVESGEVMEVDTARCIGCGLCVSTCPETAVTLLAREGTATPPAHIMALWKQMADERKG